jgi:uncharacterized protein
VYLEDVDPAGSVSDVTEGELRALHRHLSTAVPPYRQTVPYRTFKRADAQPLSRGDIAELRFDLLATSYLFEAGHRIRIAISGADASHFAVLPGGAPAVRASTVTARTRPASTCRCRHVRNPPMSSTSRDVRLR